jgi:general secretion pathway protein F
MLKVPIVDTLMLGQETARFARTLGTLLRAGVPLTHAAASACSAATNRHLKWGLERAINLVREGKSLNAALNTETVLPAMAVRMISVGEEAGKLDHMLLTIAAMLEQQTQRNVDRLMTLLTPLLTITIAVVVGSLVMAVMNAVLGINEVAVR